MSELVGWIFLILIAAFGVGLVLHLHFDEKRFDRRMRDAEHRWEG